MREPAGQGPPLIAVTALPGAAGGIAVAAAVAIAAAHRGESPAGVILCEVAAAARRPTLVSSSAARDLEHRLRGDVRASARGALCWATLTPDDWRAELRGCLDAGPAAVVAYLDPSAWRVVLASPPAELRAAVVRADPSSSGSLAGLAAIDLRRAGLAVGVVTGAPGLVSARRALAGIEPGGALAARAARLGRRLLPGAADESGQAIPLVLGLALAAVAVALLLALIGVAATGGGRVQRAADLAAVSAARSLRDDHARLFVPSRTPSGRANPRHLGEAEYRDRARAAVAEALRANGMPVGAADVSFPGAGPAPTRVRVAVRATVAVSGDRIGAEAPVRAVAVAEAYPSPRPTPAHGPAVAAGGGYSGPLAFRQGEPMRPDVAAAFDRMAAAARRAGHHLLVNSAHRSDAEQAALFAANPDPRWVAPPGTSLHRCATELDLGPASAHGWLDSAARRFGFLRRYSWEPWHFGYVEGPAPCSVAGNAVDRGFGGASTELSLPAFVPARFRDPIARAARRWNVSPGLLAAQLMAESGFNPFAMSPAGARGIAQFMPGTAAAYGLRDPFDPVAAIDAQAHLMSDLLEEFDHDVGLAIAAYNAGPGPVIACGCVPPYPETQAYVTRILGLLGGAGEITPPALEVRLVR